MRRGGRGGNDCGLLLDETQVGRRRHFAESRLYQTGSVGVLRRRYGSFRRPAYIELRHALETPYRKRTKPSESGRTSARPPLFTRFAIFVSLSALQWAISRRTAMFLLPSFATVVPPTTMSLSPCRDTPEATSLPSPSEMLAMPFGVPSSEVANS